MGDLDVICAVCYIAGANVELANDPLYQPLVLPDYQLHKARAERMAAQLYKLGIAEE